jgi:hypothetical protein
MDINTRNYLHYLAALSLLTGLAAPPDFPTAEQRSDQSSASPSALTERLTSMADQAVHERAKPDPGHIWFYRAWPESTFRRIPRPPIATSDGAGSVPCATSESFASILKDVASHA